MNNDHAKDDPMPRSKLPVVIGEIDPLGITVDESGNLCIADDNSNRVLKISAVGVLTTFAGNGEAGFSGEGGPAMEAELGRLGGIAVDGSVLSL